MEVVSEEVEAASAAAVLEEEASEAVAPEADSNHNQLYYTTMYNNTFGNIFRLTSFGESHGKAIGGVIDGFPAGIAIDMDFIQQELDRRRIFIAFLIIN